MQVLHINLDQPPISQSDLVQVQAGGSSLSVQTSKPQVTMEKLPDRYHIEVKHDGPPQGHVPPPPHLLSEGVIYKPLLGEILHPNLVQISSNSSQVSRLTNFLTLSNKTSHTHTLPLFFFNRIPRQLAALRKAMRPVVPPMTNSWQGISCPCCPDSQVRVPGQDSRPMASSCSTRDAYFNSDNTNLLSSLIILRF